MTIRIFIKRKLKGDDEKRANELLVRARTNAIEEKGYISSETLRSIEDPHEIVVVSTWQNKEDWDRYRQNPNRREVQAEFDKILDGPAVYSFYKLGM